MNVNTRKRLDRNFHMAFKRASLGVFKWANFFYWKLWDKMFSGKFVIIVSLHERSSARQTGEKNCLKLYTSFNVTFRHVPKVYKWEWSAFETVCKFNLKVWWSISLLLQGSWWGVLKKEDRSFHQLFLPYKHWNLCG